MLSFRLITTGLDDVHSVIGYQINDEPAVLIQPPEGTKYSYEAMHDVNGISIPELVEEGKDREHTLRNMLFRLFDEDVLVWYAPFIQKFKSQVEEEIDQNSSPHTKLIDVYALAKQKMLNSPSYKLADVYDYTGTSNLVELKEYIDKLPEPKRVRRV